MPCWTTKRWCITPSVKWQPCDRHQLKTRAASLGSRAAVLRRREQTRFIVCERRRSRRVHSAIRAERSEAIAHGNRAPPHGGEASRGVLSSASDDDGGGFTARCASSLRNKSPHHDGNPGAKRSPSVGQIKKFGITKIMINAVRLLNRCPRPALTERRCIGIAAGSYRDQ